MELLRHHCFSKVLAKVKSPVLSNEERTRATAGDMRWALYMDNKNGKLEIIDKGEAKELEFSTRSI
jgi:hypothetical protein